MEEQRRYPGSIIILLKMVTFSTFSVITSETSVILFTFLSHAVPKCLFIDFRNRFPWKQQVNHSGSIYEFRNKFMSLLPKRPFPEYMASQQCNKTFHCTCFVKDPIATLICVYFLGPSKNNLSPVSLFFHYSSVNLSFVFKSRLKNASNKPKTS